MVTEALNEIKCSRQNMSPLQLPQNASSRLVRKCQKKGRNHKNICTDTLKIPKFTKQVSIFISVLIEESMANWDGAYIDMNQSFYIRNSGRGVLLCLIGDIMPLIS